MQYRRLGRSGLKVSVLCLGAMMFGDRTGEAEAGRIVASARAAGVNFVDTADAYAKGESERILGRLVAADRERWVVATKVGNTGAPPPDDADLSRRHVMRAIDASLERLGMDHVDLYYLHLDDAATPLEETVATMGDLVRAGKIRYWGVSNFRAWRIAEAVMLADRLGVPRPAVCQPYYNAVNRMPEVEVLPACEHFGLGVVPYSPLARGVLTGKYRPGEPPPADTRAGRGDKRMMQTEFRAESLVIAEKIKAQAERRGMSAGQFALNWVLNSGAVTSVLAGPRTMEQWTEYLGALGQAFGAEDEALVETLVAPGHPSTPGFNDP
ncbi:MAG TPA: aldo/keto reductase, partial [Burkholderiales bacterium]|nr:aldo/keto reductase [Burkholderiales bacterium]